MPADSTFSRGDRVDRYEIRELIGEGGMGAIYRAIDTRLARTVALKVVRAARLGSSAGEQARQRFLREALAVSKVEHRNVVRVFDFGFSGDTPYLAMEYLRGQDLGKLVKASSGFLPIVEIVDVMLGVCAAIQACHDVGIIHRDLKPSNIFLCESDSEREVKILDFGVSKAPMASDLTTDGQILGTPQFLAPEQIDGKALPQTDQYAIGVVLYACVTKSLPYQGHESLSLLRAIDVGKFTPPCALRPDLPKKLEGIILRAMRAAPEERFESVHALGRELWEFASQEARERWRLYYVDKQPKPAAKASAHAMPLIEAMARGLAVGDPSSDPVSVPLTATATPDPAAQALDDAAHLAALASTAPAGDKPAPVGLARTPAAPAPAKPATADLLKGGTIAEEKVGGASAKWWATVALIAAGAVGLAGAGWLALRRPIGAETSTTAVPVAPVAPAPTAPTAPPAQQPTLADPPPAPALTRESPHREAAQRTPPPTRLEKRHRRRNTRGTPSEYTADGVPIMP